ncbi:hypothetical protein EB118_14045 [bacterium]|nr:hypothetical protein [bacterium]
MSDNFNSKGSTSKNIRNQDTGGGASTWASFPAIGNVNMSNYYISNLKGINNSSTSLVGNVLTISADKSIVWAPASGGGGGNIALWATCNAVQNVNLAGNSIININNVSTATLNASVDVYIRGTSVSSSIITLSQGISNISGYVYTQIPSICGAITSLSGNVSNISGYVYTQIPSICGAITSLSGYVYTLSGAQFWANFAAVNNVNVSGFSISNISSAFVSNNATISGTLTVSAEIVRNNLNVSGLTTVSGLTVQNVLTVGGNISGVTKFNSVDVKFGLVDNLIALGQSAGYDSSGSDVIAIGQSAGQDNSGSFVIAIGQSAGYNNSGSFVIALGSFAGNNSSGSDVIALGSFAGNNNSGSYVIALGDNAGNSSSGSDVIAIGQSAGNSSSGSDVIAIGNGAGYDSSGSDVIALGQSAGNSSSGSDVIAIGKSAGYDSSGSDVIAIGQSAGNSSYGSDVIAIGQSAGQDNSGSFVIAIGQSAGYNNNGDNSIFIGNNTLGITNASNDQFIVYSTGTTPIIQGRLDCNFLGINCNSPNYTLDVSGTTNTRGLTISGISFPQTIPNPTDVSGSRYVLTLSDSSTFSWRRPPQATYGLTNPTVGSTPNFGISGDVYFKVSSVTGGQAGTSVTLFFA